MKKVIQIFAIVLLFALCKQPEVLAQSSGSNWLIDTTTIPITAGLHWYFTTIPGAMDSMRAVVDGVGLDLGLIDGHPGGPGADAQMNFLTSRGFHIIPADVYKGNTFYRWVEYYSDAHYTEWEVEGEFGDTSYLQHNPNVMEEDYDGDTTFIKLKSNAVCGEKGLMWGPYYSQYIYGLTETGTYDTIQYTAKFRMRLEENPNPPSCPDTIVWSDDPSEPICRIQVTKSKLYDQNQNWEFECTYPVLDSIIRLGDFNPLNQFLNIQTLPYNLISDDCQSTAPGEPIPQANTGDMSITNDIDLALKQSRYIQFKVIWLGNPNYLLSIDKVTVYDNKGLIVMTPNSEAVTNIHHQLDQLSQYNPNIIGWLGRDEPNSIDQYAPLMKVNEIINSYSTASSKLWFPLMGKWDGRYNQINDPWGTYHLSPWKEMKKRIGDVNVWQDFYYFDYPYCIDCPIPVPPPPGEDYRVKNIYIAAELNYKQAYDLDPNYGVSLQCGEVHLGGIAQERDITDYEFLYETNLALMYGAKFLSLYTYFAQ